MTSLASEAASAQDGDELVAWKLGTIAYDIDLNEVIQGGDVLVALPKNSDAALYSEDKGATWQPADPPLPHSGCWTGCYGDNGFVAICIDDGQAVASYSQTGKSWTLTQIELPIAQKWSKVIFAETGGFTPNQYLAVGGIDSSIAAVSSTGWAWEISSLPVAQEWRSAFAANGDVFIVGGNSNVMLSSTDCIHWTEVILPVTAAWSDGCHGAGGFIVVADTLYGSGSRQPIALKSADGKTWEVIPFAIGCWQSIEFGNSLYMAVGERQSNYSLDGDTWQCSTLPVNSTSVSVVNDSFVCPLGTNKYLLSDSASTIKGTFNLEIPVGEGYEISNVYLSAAIENTAGDTSYASNGEKLLATSINAADNAAEPQATGGEPIAITTDLRYGTGIDGVMMSATFDKDTKTATIEYIADSNHTSVLNAPLTVTAQYQAASTTDLGYDGLVVEFDNQNQIITTNKKTLNMYEYFNKKFLRLVKGLNRLKVKTEGGKCKMTLTSEFLRKVGGR